MYFNTFMPLYPPFPGRPLEWFGQHNRLKTAIERGWHFQQLHDNLFFMCFQRVISMASVNRTTFYPRSQSQEPIDVENKSQHLPRCCLNCLLCNQNHFSCSKSTEQNARNCEYLHSSLCNFNSSIIVMVTNTCGYVELVVACFQWTI